MKAPDQFTDTVAGITALLAARHDALTILRAVTDACGSLFSADATGTLVRDPRGGLAVIDASDTRAGFTEFLQAHTGEGPCVDCITANALVGSADLRAEQRWQSLVTQAQEVGFHALYALPLRLVDKAIGGLNVFFSEPTPLSEWQLAQAQSLADLAVLGLTQERDKRRIERFAERTMTTLNDRARVQQAAGIIAATFDMDREAARAAIVGHSERSNRTLLEVANGVLDGTLSVETIVPSP